MNYEEFLNYIKEHLIDCFREMALSGAGAGLTEEECRQAQDVAESGEVKIHQVTKNNGIVLDAAAVFRKGETVSPEIYLRPYYDRYQMGKSTELLMADMVRQYLHTRDAGDLQIADPADFNAVKERIIVRLVNYEMNREALMDCPHGKYLDLAVTFRYFAGFNEEMMASYPITNAQYGQWGVELSELTRLAVENTMRFFPCCIRPLWDVLSGLVKRAPEVPEEMVQEVSRMESDPDMLRLFVLTNQESNFGAACMLYDNVIRDFAKKMGTNVFILPSSVHELMLVPENEHADPAFFSELVRDTNRSAVGLIDLLSDSVYYYDREQDCITVAGPETK